MSSFKKIEDLKPIEKLIEECEYEAREALEAPYVFNKAIKNVAVIGAGPSGLPAIRHLKEAGINVRAFERSNFAGGLWNYSERAPLKPTIPSSSIKREVDLKAINAPLEGQEKEMLDMTPETVNFLLKKYPSSPCYRDLFTNTSTKLFAYPDFPFPEETSILCHRQVIEDYFRQYAEKFYLLPSIQFNTSVDLVKKKGDIWEVSLCRYDINADGMVKLYRWKETFDAIVCATGKHTEAFVPDIKDLTAWNKLNPAKVSHSNQFRRPEDFKDKNVLVVGSRISAVDIVRAVDGFAKSITMSIRSDLDIPSNRTRTVRGRIPSTVAIKSIASFSNPDGVVDGTITFKDGTTLDTIDHVIFCTGYKNRFEFLGDQVIEQTDEEAAADPKPNYRDLQKGQVVINKEAPVNVYHEVFLMSDPTLAFVGIPPYPTSPTHFDIHAQCVSRVWSGRAFLPNEKLMFKFDSEFDADVSIVDIYNADRRNLVPFVAWLNFQAKVIDSKAPLLSYLDEEYEIAGRKGLEMWGDLSEKNLQETKKYIREHYL